MKKSKGRYLRLSTARRLMDDLMHLSVGRPLIPMEREMDLAPLVAARQKIQIDRPGWCAIFVKAYGVLSKTLPEFRQSFIPYPWSRIYESHEPAAAIAVERELEGELAVLAGVLKSPQQMSLREIEGFLLKCKTGPLREVKSIKRTLRMLRWPRLFRRLILSWVINWRGVKRAEEFGTFGVSVTAGMGAATLALLSPLTTTLHYGLFDPFGKLPVRITFDHRVLDGGVVARAMVRLEEILRGEILAELQALANA